jgi:ATP synthase protein I
MMNMIYIHLLINREDAILRQKNRHPLQAMALMSATLSQLAESIAVRPAFRKVDLRFAWFCSAVFGGWSSLRACCRDTIHAAYSPTIFLRRINSIMPELELMFIRQRKYIMFLLAIYVACAGFTPYRSVFLGLILGTAFSLFNLWSMVQKNRKFSEAVAAEKKVKSLGSLTRISMGALAAVIALRYPEHFHIVSVVIGLMTAYLVIMIDFVIQNLRDRKKRGEY